jgi:hypothetical protein
MAFVLLAATAVRAQSEYRQYEVTPFFGTRFGGNIDLSQQGNPNIDYLRIKNSMNYGVMGGVTFWQNFQGESYKVAARTSTLKKDQKEQHL